MHISHIPALRRIIVILVLIAIASLLGFAAGQNDTGASIAAPAASSKSSP
jgi:hypothetical protein